MFTQEVLLWNHGDPIPAMLERVKQWIAEGRDVRIFTARASNLEYIPPYKTGVKSAACHACRSQTSKISR